MIEINAWKIFLPGRTSVRRINRLIIAQLIFMPMVVWAQTDTGDGHEPVERAMGSCVDNPTAVHCQTTQSVTDLSRQTSTEQRTAPGGIDFCLFYESAINCRRARDWLTFRPRQ